MRSEHPIEELRLILRETVPELRVVAPVVEQLVASSTTGTQKKELPVGSPLVRRVG
jgi:hypothetical protein